MNDLDTPRNEAAVSSAITSLQAELDSLRSLLLGLVTVIILLSGSVNLFLLRQATLARAQVNEGQKVIDDYKNHVRPAALEFWAKLNTFAKTNPDLGQILSK